MTWPIAVLLMCATALAPVVGCRFIRVDEHPPAAHSAGKPRRKLALQRSLPPGVEPVSEEAPLVGMTPERETGWTLPPVDLSDLSDVPHQSRWQRRRLALSDLPTSVEQQLSE